MSAVANVSNKKPPRSRKAKPNGSVIGQKLVTTQPSLPLSFQLEPSKLSTENNNEEATDAVLLSAMAKRSKVKVLKKKPADKSDASSSQPAPRNLPKHPFTRISSLLQLEEDTQESNEPETVDRAEVAADNSSNISNQGPSTTTVTESNSKETIPDVAPASKTKRRKTKPPSTAPVDGSEASTAQAAPPRRTAAPRRARRQRAPATDEPPEVRQQRLERRELSRCGTLWYRVGRRLAVVLQKKEFYLVDGIPEEALREFLRMNNAIEELYRYRQFCYQGQHENHDQAMLKIEVCEQYVRQIDRKKYLRTLRAQQ
ncbi:unnamed protein product [Caenorhabditis bovis]|uniref:Uncharacterized protein n=1 Tax=Caenorhabditis bovis TaxID=2654633 RepID=A0A8S1FEP4_9PELO|nr:unnamed protein product [Caenorhabditis bovis]